MSVSSDGAVAHFCLLVISIDLSPVGSLLATGSGDWQARICAHSFVLGIWTFLTSSFRELYHDTSEQLKLNAPCTMKPNHADPPKYLITARSKSTPLVPLRPSKDTRDSAEMPLPSSHFLVRRARSDGAAVDIPFEAVSPLVV